MRGVATSGRKENVVEIFVVVVLTFRWRKVSLEKFLFLLHEISFPSESFLMCWCNLHARSYQQCYSIHVCNNVCIRVHAIVHE